MKKASVMSTIALIGYILALLLIAAQEVIFYIWLGSMGVVFDARFWMNIALYDGLLFIGMLILMVGVKLAANNKAWALYPIGFLIVMSSHILSLFNASAWDSIRLLFSVIALLLLALDHFIRPRVKVMGILGAVILFVTMLVYLVVGVVEMIQYSSSYFGTDNLWWFLERVLYVIGFQIFALAALLFAIGRQPRIPKTAPAPQPVYPPYTYQPPQYNPPQMPQTPQQPNSYSYQPPQDGRPNN